MLLRNFVAIEQPNRFLWTNKVPPPLGHYRRAAPSSAQEFLVAARQADLILSENCWQFAPRRIQEPFFKRAKIKASPAALFKPTPTPRSINQHFDQHSALISTYARKVIMSTPSTILQPTLPTTLNTHQLISTPRRVMSTSPTPSTTFLFQSPPTPTTPATPTSSSSSSNANTITGPRRVFNLLLAGAGSGVVCTILCAPLDVLKTRIQTQAGERS
jgi:hypothetical protein